MKVESTQAQRNALDAAVLSFIRSHDGARSMDIMNDPSVKRVIDKLPKEKPALRWLDNSLQRLRRNLEIVATNNRWRSTTTKVIP